MSLANVLSRLEGNENRFINLSNQYGEDALRLSEKQSKDKLDSISTFSQTLSEELVRRKQEENEREEKEGEIDAIEEDMDKYEKDGDIGVPIEEKINYYDGVEELKENKTTFDTAALQVQENGGSFTESEQVRNMSGWRLYGYTKQKAIMAGDSYKDWMEGAMANNNELQLSFGGRDFTPSQAKSIEEKSFAMGALRRQYLEERGLLGVNRVLLADNFYDKAITSHSQIMANYEKEDAIERSFDIEEQAFREFKADNDFYSLISTLAPTWDKTGKKRNRRGALDKGIEIIKDLMDSGDIGEDELAAIRAQKITINGKETTVGKYWDTRFDLLEEELIKEGKANIQSDLDELEIKAKTIERDFRNWIKERIKNKEDITEAHLEKWAEIYETATGDIAPSFITDYKSKEDRDDEDDLNKLRVLRKRRGFLVESDLSDVSEFVYEKAKTWVVEDKPLSELPKKYGTEADRKIKAWTVKAVGLQEGERETVEYERGYWAATADYDQKVQDFIRDGETQKNAHKLALQEVEDEFDFDSLLGSIGISASKYFNKTEVKRTKERLRATANGIRFISKYETKEDKLTALSQTPIKETEKYLQQGKDFKSGKTKEFPEFYTRLAESFPKLSDWDILDAALKASGDKDGLGEKPDVLEVLDDPLLEELQRKLNKLTNKTQVEQAKHDVGDIQSYMAGTFSYSIFNSDQKLLTPGLYVLEPN